MEVNNNNAKLSIVNEWQLDKQNNKRLNARIQYQKYFGTVLTRWEYRSRVNKQNDQVNQNII